MLALRNAQVDRSELPILKGVSLDVPAGRVVSLLGPNGAGKTTLLSAISGIFPCRSGSIEFLGRRIDRLDPAEVVRAGIGHVPQNRELFWEMTVRENLEAGVLGSGKRREFEKSAEQIFDYFPALRPRARQIAGTLSGGEQQMLAIARALIGSPKLLMLDEPSAGLAPRIVAGIGELISQLKREGLTILLVEQNIPLALDRSDYTYVLVNGAIRIHGETETARHRWDFAALYLSGSAGSPDGTPGRGADISLGPG